jgi:protease PrsW
MSGLLILALAPVFIIAFYVYFRDKYEKEPWPNLLLALLVGVLVAFPVIYAERLMDFIGSWTTGLLEVAWHSFLVAALCEEGFKILAVFLLFWKSREFNEKFDGIIYGCFISLGFAGIENVFYVLESGYTTGLARALTAVPAHAFFGISMGYFVGMARFYPKRQKKFTWYAFLLPFSMHGFYDFILMSRINLLLLTFIPFMIYLWVSGFKRMKELNESSIYRNDLDLGIDFGKVKDYKPDSKKEN